MNPQITILGIYALAEIAKARAITDTQIATLLRQRRSINFEIGKAQQQFGGISNALYILLMKPETRTEYHLRLFGISK